MGRLKPFVMQFILANSYITLFIKFERAVFYGKRWRELISYVDTMSFEEIDLIFKSGTPMSREATRILRERQGKLALL